MVKSDEMEELDPKAFKMQIKRIGANIKKEITNLWNDKFAMLLLFLLPITLIFTIHFAGGVNHSLLITKQEILLLPVVQLPGVHPILLKKQKRDRYKALQPRKALGSDCTPFVAVLFGFLAEVLAH